MDTPADKGKNEKDPTDLGTNRTGASTSPIDTPRAVEFAARFGKPDLEPAGLANMRLQYSTEAEPVGSMAPPTTIKGMAKTAVQALKGNKATVFLDLLAERLAYERTGTRIYDAILVKFDAAVPRGSGPTRAELEEIRNEELSHFLMLKEAVQTLGGDPTMMSPSADTTFVATSGIVKMVSDPRTTLTQALKGALTAELTDTASWAMLADLADRLGHDEMAGSFRRALEREERHLLMVRTWVEATVSGQAGVEDETTSTETRPTV
jgi:rubrerythrin